MDDRNNIPGGWISIHNSLRYHWIWDCPKYLKWWIDMLFLAEYKDTKRFVVNKTFIIKRGQFIASVRYLRERWVSIDEVTGKKHLPSLRTVTRFLTMLKDDNMIEKVDVKTPRAVTVFTICKYDIYQSFLGTPGNSVGNSDGNSVGNSVDNTVGNSDGNSVGNELHNSTTTTSTRTCAREEGLEQETESDKETRYFQLLESSKQYWEQCGILLHLSPAELSKYFANFRAEIFATERWHKNFSDLKKHFLSWARIAISKSKNNGANSKFTGGTYADLKSAKEKRDEEFAIRLAEKVGGGPGLS